MAITTSNSTSVNAPAGRDGLNPSRCRIRWAQQRRPAAQLKFTTFMGIKNPVADEFI
jgi:hypothetical protein